MPFHVSIQRDIYPHCIYCCNLNTVHHICNRKSSDGAFIFLNALWMIHDSDGTYNLLHNVGLCLSCAVKLCATAKTRPLTTTLLHTIPLVTMNPSCSTGPYITWYNYRVGMERVVFPLMGRVGSPEAYAWIRAPSLLQHCQPFSS